jgi:hypothetical protein
MDFDMVCVFCRNAPTPTPPPPSQNVAVQLQFESYWFASVQFFVHAGASTGLQNVHSFVNITGENM